MKKFTFLWPDKEIIVYAETFHNGYLVLKNQIKALIEKEYNEKMMEILIVAKLVDVEEVE